MTTVGTSVVVACSALISALATDATLTSDGVNISYDAPVLPEDLKTSAGAFEAIWLGDAEATEVIRSSPPGTSTATRPSTRPSSSRYSARAKRETTPPRPPSTPAPCRSSPECSPCSPTASTSASPTPPASKPS